MIRTRTTLILGAGANAELQMPQGPELLSRMAQGFDFSRFGTELQSKDSVVIGQTLGKLAARLEIEEEAIARAANCIRIACKLAPSIESLLEQFGDDPLIALCVKLAMVHFTSQAEAKSLLRLAPRVADDLPIQGQENWLFQLGQLVTSGVSLSGLERCLDNLAIVTFNADRAIEHFMPHALAMAYGLSLENAQVLVGEKLNVLHACGSVGRMPWQPGDEPVNQWATEMPSNLVDLAMELRTGGEALHDQTRLKAIRSAVSGARRLVFLGFDYQPHNLDLLMDYGLSQDTEILATAWEMPPAIREMTLRMLRRNTGIENAELVSLFEKRPFELLRDFGGVLES